MVATSRAVTKLPKTRMHSQWSSAAGASGGTTDLFFTYWTDYTVPPTLGPFNMFILLNRWICLQTAFSGFRTHFNCEFQNSGSLYNSARLTLLLHIKWPLLNHETNSHNDTISLSTIRVSQFGLSNRSKTYTVPPSCECIWNICHDGI